MNEEYEALMRLYILTSDSDVIDEDIVKYAAVDKDGALWCYAVKPGIESDSYWAISEDTTENTFGGGRVSKLKPCKFWKDTLIKL